MMENRIKMDDLGVPLFSETSTCLWSEKREEEVFLLRQNETTHNVVYACWIVV